MGSRSGERAETAALLKDVDPWNGGRRTRKLRQIAEYKNKETIQNIHLPVSAKNVAYVLTDLEKEKNKKKRKKRQKHMEENTGWFYIFPTLSLEFCVLFHYYLIGGRYVTQDRKQWSSIPRTTCVKGDLPTVCESCVPCMVHSHWFHLFPAKSRNDSKTHTTHTILRVHTCYI